MEGSGSQLAVKVTVIVVNYNGAQVLGDCVRSIVAQDYPADHVEIIVADNGSRDGSAELPELSTPRVRLLRFDENLGFAEANNRAIRASQSAWVALVNSDAVLAPGWLSALVNALRAEPQAGAAACQTLQAFDRSKLDAAGFAFFSCCSCDSWTGRSPESLDSATHRPFGPVASAALYRRSALEDVGLFHSEYFCYYEDTDLAVRLVLHGYSTVYVHAAVAYHRGSHTGVKSSDFHV
ncbi:MAG: hypothetical protein RL701_6387, partial [Pseudomonadota bacterium]